MNPGTYVGLRVLQPSNAELFSFCTKSGIVVKKTAFERRLHVTVIYSTKHCPHMTVDKSKVHEAQFVNYDLFTSRDGDKVLVVKLSAPSVVARHLQLMEENDATYDHPVYTPHITLTYSCKNINFAKLPPIEFPIQLGDEYKEDLNLDWSKDNADK